MHMRKNKAGLLLMCFMLVFASVPVSAADVDEQGVFYDDEENGGIAEDTMPDDEDTSGSDEGKTDIRDDAQNKDSEGKDTLNTVSGNTDGEDGQKENTAALETSEPDNNENKTESGLVKNAVGYDLSSQDMEVRIKNGQAQYTYTGEEIKPEIEVLYHGQADETPKVISPEFYQVKYENNIHAGNGTVIVTGIDDPSVKDSGEENNEQSETDSYVGIKKTEFQIAPADINSCQFQIPTTAGYTGKAVTLKIVVKYQGKQLAEGKDYTTTYTNNKKKGKAGVEIKGIGDFTGSKKAAFTIKLATPSVKVSSSYSKITLKWSKIKSASGYVIYRSTSLKGKYKKIKTYTSGSKTSYSDSSAKFGKKYYYKVRAYENVTVKVKGKTKKQKEYSSLSTAVCGQRMLSAVTMKSVKCVTKTTAKLTWKKVTGAQGYEIYRSKSADSGYVRAASIKGNGTVSYTAKKLTPGVKYYFKVRAYRKSGSKKYYSAFSAPKQETFAESQRLYLLFPNGVPTTKAQMEKYLVTITVPIKDVEGNPGTMQLRVHKALTREFMGAFQEMYAIGFPVRAEDTDTYKWRTMASGKSRSHHSYGCVVDLNWNSNPMIGVTEGKYRPGVDPYSVTPQVVAIWKKYGFYWGGAWKSSKDYMHFTYTNH